MNTDEKKTTRLVVDNISKTIGKSTVLHDISLTLKSSTIHGLVGVNGSGKTMLMRALAGLIRPTAGTIRYHEGENIIDFLRLNIGLTLEHADFFPHLTGRKNLMILAQIRRLIDSADVDAAIKRVGLDPDDKRKVSEYSLGMKQRLAIAQAIMERPDYLFLDEPMNALDEKGCLLIRKIIREEAERGAVVLLVSHSKDDISELCEVVFQMEEGRLK